MELETSTYSLLHLCMRKNAESSAVHLSDYVNNLNFFEQWLPGYQLWFLPRLSSYILSIRNTRNSKHCNLALWTGVLCLVEWLGKVDRGSPAPV